MHFQLGSENAGLGFEGEMWYQGVAIVKEDKQARLSSGVNQLYENHFHRCEDMASYF